MSRSAIDQGLVTGGSIIAGFTAGAVGSLTLDGLPRPIGGLIVRSAGVGVAGARASAVFGGQSPMAPVGNSTVVGWTDAGLDVLGGIALSRLLTSERGVLPRAVGLAGFGASMAEGTVESLSARSDDPD
ncbi:MAG: hypothetical protein KDB69_03110, partial [Acidimicrobiia bacterium]|nr:hypothetical protein [Acidimicrobiia bacterium]